VKLILRGPLVITEQSNNQVDDEESDFLFIKIGYVKLFDFLKLVQCTRGKRFKDLATG
jgi:hypothetical protein